LRSAEVRLTGARLSVVLSVEDPVE
jgi:hypothetical protein